MKPYVMFFGTALVVIAVGIVMVGQQFSVVTPSGSVAGCAVPITGSNIICSVTDGYYASVNGAAYVKINAALGGVSSFNGRAGVVVPASGDYSYAQITGTPAAPTTISCTTAQLSSGSSGTFTASGCTLK